VAAALLVIFARETAAIFTSKLAAIPLDQQFRVKLHVQASVMLCLGGTHSL